MKVTQKAYEIWCNEHRNKMHNNWELYATAGYAYITAVQEFKKKLTDHLHERYDPHCGDYFVSIDHMMEIIDKFGEDKHEIEIEDHQLGPKSVEKEAEGSS